MSRAGATLLAAIAALGVAACSDDGARRQLGAACSAPAECDSGLCVDRVCVTGGGLGEACDAASPCELALACLEAICRSPLRGDCNARVDCAPDLVCEAGACLTARGGRCDVEADCVAGLVCHDGACLAAAGGVCDVATDCVPDLDCEGGVCAEPATPRAPDGTPCVDAKTCASSVCANGVCGGRTCDDDLAEGLARPCDLTAGVCAAVTRPAARCVDGVWRPCEAADYAAASPSWQPDEASGCDGLDNDCDGATDEGCVIRARAAVVSGASVTPTTRVVAGEAAVSLGAPDSAGEVLDLGVAR